MRLTILMILLLGVVYVSIGQANRINFSLLAQNDQVKDSLRNTEYLKFKSVIPNGSPHHLSFGGGFRQQVEAFVNEQFDNQLDQTDIWFLTRVMFHTRYEYKDKLLIFGELNSSTIQSKENLTPVDRDDLAVNQLFISYRIGKFSLLAGRENLRLGSGRLVDIREGPNVRLSFDLVRAVYRTERSSFQFMHAVPVSVGQGIFDNRSFQYNEYMNGAYYTANFNNAKGLDLYVLHKFEEDKTWNKGTADDDRYSIGSRFFGGFNRFIFDTEWVYQFGSFGDNQISAYTISMKLAKELDVGKQVMLVGIKSEVISGDRDTDDNELNTFDALYPRGAYFGRVARFGPSNLFDLHPWVEFNWRDYHISLDYVAFWRFSANDGVYNPALILDYPAVNSELFIGHQIGTITSRQLNNFLFIELETNVIFPGEFLIESGLNDVLFHTVATFEARF